MTHCLFGLLFPNLKNRECKSQNSQILKGPQDPHEAEDLDTPGLRIVISGAKDG